MNESDFENELRALRLTEPSRGLEGRISAELATSTVPTRTSGVLGSRTSGSQVFVGWLRSLGWAMSGAAAAIAGVLYFQGGAPQASQPSQEIAAIESATDDVLPVESENEFVDADATGILYTEGAEPFRQMRFRSVERYSWTNPDTGAHVEVEVPREDIVMMPVAMQ